MSEDRSTEDQADPGPAFAGREPPPPAPGAAFTRMRDAFDRDHGRKPRADPDPEEPPVLPVLAKLMRQASERCVDAGRAYITTKSSQESTAPASFMRTIGMVLSVAADSLDDLADA